jgi:hypothetical protein
LAVAFGGIRDHESGPKKAEILQTFGSVLTVSARLTGEPEILTEPRFSGLRLFIH